MRTTTFMNKQAFSLVELLLVVGIIAAFAAFISSGMLAVRDDAQQAAMFHAVKNVQITANALVDNNGSFGAPYAVGQPCNQGVFAQTELQQLFVDLQQRFDGVIQCGVGPAGQTFALAVQTTALTSICIDATQTWENAVAAGGGVDPAVCVEN